MCMNVHWHVYVHVYALVCIVVYAYVYLHKVCISTYTCVQLRDSRGFELDRKVK